MNKEPRSLVAGNLRSGTAGAPPPGSWYSTPWWAQAITVAGLILGGLSLLGRLLLALF